MKLEDYQKQLPELCRIIRAYSLTLQLHYDEQSHSVLMRMQSPPRLPGNVDHVEFKILYSHVFQEPQLLVRLWRATTRDGISYIEPWYPKDVHDTLNVPTSFQLGLDTISDTTDKEQCAWYSFHACDTADIVGNKPEYINDYLQRWASVFIFSWFLQSEKKK
ncbi:ATG10 (YLL042C) [Zygosaccharomyces parabailii]|nr:ATG10 (YLL042C) [Zygosaccharomyces parabailii]